MFRFYVSTLWAPHGWQWSSWNLFKHLFNCLFHFYVSAWSEPHGWQWSSCTLPPPLSSDLSSTLFSNSLSFAWSMKYNKLIQFLMKPPSPHSHVDIDWSLPWVYTLSVKISLLVVPGGVQFVNTDYKSWPDFIQVYIMGKTEDQFQSFHCMTMWIVFFARIHHTWGTYFASSTMWSAMNFVREGCQGSPRNWKVFFSFSIQFVFKNVF